MSAEENKAIARRFAQVWNAGGSGIVDELAAPNITVSYPIMPASIQGAESFKQYLTQTYAGLPDIQTTVEDLIAEGDQVVARWSYRATHQGELFGNPATGKQVQVSGITIYRIANGKVVEERGVSDALGMMQQLGVVPSPGQPGA